jgi:ABC-type antimicrobial peptide transport system permease subunit
VHWQAATIAVLALAFGVPTGVVVGRLAWQSLISDLGIVVDATTPWSAVVALSLLVIVAALLVGILPARSASRGRLSRILVGE